jgi:protein required for attachment to host cells
LLDRMRVHYGEALRAVIIAELGKNLTNLPLDKIKTAIEAA